MVMDPMFLRDVEACPDPKSAYKPLIEQMKSLGMRYRRAVRSGLFPYVECQIVLGHKCVLQKHWLV